MPRAVKFTDDNIRAEAVPGKRLFVRDCANLYLYTSPNRKRQRWIFRFSKPDGSGVTDRSLGRYPQVTLEMAKNRVERARLILLRDKIDPFKVEWNDEPGITFGQVVDKWFNVHKTS